MTPLRSYERLGIGFVGLPLRDAAAREAPVTFPVSCPRDILVATGASFERKLEVVLSSNPEDLGARLELRGRLRGAAI